MPSSSKAQQRFMQAVAHDPKFAKKAGVPQSVGKDYAAADEAAASPSPGMMAIHAEKMKRKMKKAAA